jgi:hypothetical protein
MENLNDKFYWETRKRFHNIICSETNGKIESNLQDFLEESLYRGIADKSRFQLFIPLNLLLEKSMK